MIIYNVFSNNGGMLRVTESMKDIFNYLPENFPLKIVIFSKQSWPDLDPDKFFWVPWDDSSEKMVTVEGANYYKNIINNKFSKEKIQLVIGDSFTLQYWEDFDVPLCYDAHYLEQPFYDAFHKCPDIFSLDKFTQNPICQQLQTSELMAYKREAHYLRKCICFIANSKSTFIHFQKYYSFFTDGKPVRIVPVSSGLVSSQPATKIEYELFYAGRFHPQKGLHFLFNRKINLPPIHFRGFDPRIIPKESQSTLSEKNLIILPWIDESELLAQEISKAKVMLFPSIYEPWGLSLQEGLSMGKICVANRSQSGHEEQIVDGENGFLLDMNDFQWEIELMNILQKSPEELERISKNAKNSTVVGHEARLKSLALVLIEFETL